MTIPLGSIPDFTAAEGLAAASEAYGLAGAISALPSERDQNFSIAGARGARFVLKIANLNDAPALLDFQNQAMRRVSGALAECRVPSVVSSLDGRDITHLENPRTGTRHCVRLLNWVDGEVLAKVRPRAPALFESIGAGMAKVDAALAGFAHPAMHRVLQWDLRHAGMARENTALLPRARRRHVERLFSQWEEIDWTALRHGVIHGDANDHNVIAGGGRMVGLLDFGDLVYSAIACDLAIALAYTLLSEPEPMAVAARVIQAYHRVYPLTDAEQRVLFSLMLARLSMSVCYSAHNRARNPGDPYQVVSEAAAWELLHKLESLPAREAIALARAACEV